MVKDIDSLAFEERVRSALHQEAANVEPSGDGLRGIQERTARGAAHGRTHVGWFAAGGAALATAATVTAVVMFGAGDSARTPDTGPAGVGDADVKRLQIFYLDGTADKRGEPGSVTRDEPGLYVEVHRVPVAGGPVSAAVDELVSSLPADTDYQNPWAGTGVHSVQVTPNRVVVDLDDLPSTPNHATGQQLAHTVQAVAPDGHELVVTVDGKAVPRLGAPADPPVEAFAGIWVTSPHEGASVSSPVRFTGMAATFEGNVAYEIRRGEQMVAEGAVTSAGGMGVWSSWSFTERLHPGYYTLVAYDVDPALGGRRDIDTKQFTVR